MTDEERARLAVDKMPGLTKAQRADWVDALVSLAAAIRADQREKCAQAAEREVSSAQARAGSLTFCSRFTCLNMAAAIRAMGDK